MKRSASNRSTTTYKKPATQASHFTSRSLELYGVDKPPPTLKSIRLGVVSVDITQDSGALRAIRVNDHTICSGATFQVRDASWGTPSTSVTKFSQDALGCVIEASVAGMSLSTTLTLEAKDENCVEVRYAVRAVAQADVRSARCGLIVLHPVEGLQGVAVAVNGKGGSHWPGKRIEPNQLFTDVRSLTYAHHGVEVTCSFQAADVFEVEDQRQWGDASYKTYVRPLRLEWPYLVSKGQVVEQCFVMTLASLPRLMAQVAKVSMVSLTLGKPTGHRMPNIDTGFDATKGIGTEFQVESLLPLRGITGLVCLLYVEPSSERSSQNTVAFRSAVATSKYLGCPLSLEVVIDDSSVNSSVEVLVELLKSENAGTVSRIALCTKAHMGASAVQDIYLPSHIPRPPVPGLESAVVGALRQALGDFGASRPVVGGSCFTSFVELNRRRPLGLEFASFGFTSLIHDADDLAVMSSLASLPHIIDSAAALYPDIPLHIAPASISTRFNTFGVAEQVFQSNEGRIEMSSRDPRDCSYFGGAWCVGFMANICAATKLPTSIAFGTIFPDAPRHRWSLEQRPAHAVVVTLAKAMGARLFAVEGLKAPLEALAWESESGAQLLVANLSKHPVSIEVPGKVGPPKFVVGDCSVEYGWLGAYSSTLFDIVA